MARLASPIENIQDYYTVVVIGSGYGGGIAASRLARAGQKVCLLERGKEFQPGEYPDTTPAALPEMQGDFPDGHIGSRVGLYDFHVNDDINVFKGCGLGGTSLVNANVALEPDPRVFDDPRWPQALRDDVATLLAEGFAHATEMLKPSPYPDGYPPLPKLLALEKSSKNMAGRFYRPPINVNFEVDGLNHVGVEQKPCTNCGNCVSGCNDKAKNTLLMNYLPDAKNHGAEIYTQVDVRYIERKEGKWLVYYHALATGQEAFDIAPEFVTADVVVLAGGTLGSTEILLRSRANGLAVSNHLGQGFTGNGDVLAFAYNTDVEINGIGYGNRRPGTVPPVGPCITGIIDQRATADLEQGMVIEEGSVTSALTLLLPQAFAAAAAAVGKNTEQGLPGLVREKMRELESLVQGAYHGATRNTQTYLVMAHDDDRGQMVLENDRLRVKWPTAGSQSIFQTANDRLDEATKPLGGYYVENPIWSKWLKQQLITVHPLGGCVMAEQAENGVVNHRGQVFSGPAGADVYDGLYVSDGSIVPRSLGVNPLITISALAERSCALMAQERNWQIDYRLPSAPAVVPVPELPAIGVRFTETMRGFVSPNVKSDYAQGEQQGRDAAAAFAFTLTIASEDLNAMLTEETHAARMVGEVVAPALSPTPLTVTDGVFHLFVRDPAQADVRRMGYRMRMRSETGVVYWLEGFKTIPNHPVWDSWADTTTLYTTVYAGEDASAPVWGVGILHIAPGDFLKQITTFQVLNTTSAEEKVKATARFGSFFAGTLWEMYGGIFSGPSAFDPEAPPRVLRPLRVCTPRIYGATASDGVALRLTRYQGGTKGPVILSHGLGVSSKIFAIDTIETNLLEYLFAHGYDVWLLDYRSSIALPTEAAASANADDVATKDYPAAVQKVIEVTGRPDVQMVAHCYGSTTFFMAMLAGLQGVRSAVSSQIATHVRVPLLNRLRCGLHLPDFLDRLGIETLTAYADTHEDWLNRIYDKGLDLYAVEAQGRCDSAVCHRITFMYASLYEHAQLNEATHAAQYEMFGVASIEAFEHLALMVRKGQLVSAAGEDAYIPHLERLAIPISFIHGANNECFLPESTEITVRLLSERNGTNLYSRHVIPGYGHIDCIYGKNAVQDVYPFILHHLEKTA